MKLNSILDKINPILVKGDVNKEIATLRMDSRKLEADSLFFAVRGNLTDGHKYIDAAIESGAIAIICEEMPDTLKENVTYIKVSDTPKAMAECSARFFGNPSEAIVLVGITGTNGKTTTATLLYELFRSMGYKVGLISTVRNYIDDMEIPATHTTPDVISLNHLLSAMVQAGCSHCFMEVSSHAVEQRRIEGLHFGGGVFTNLTHDHIDYHGNFSNYLKAKQKFFNLLPRHAFALYNNDDKNGQLMVQNTLADKYSYGLKTAVDYKARVIESHIDGQLLKINAMDIWTHLPGTFNAYNFTCVYAITALLGINENDFLTKLSNLKAVEGRFENFVSDAGSLCVVDYAHTPDALQNVLTTLNAIRNMSGKLITIVGCGGDRDKAKRPIMASIACKESDIVILTSDNPRTENPKDIIEHMQAGLTPVQSRKVLVIENRKEAIKTACTLAGNADVLLVAGKGHEKYQEINGVKYPFDDLQIMKEMLTPNR